MVFQLCVVFEGGFSARSRSGFVLVMGLWLMRLQDPLKGWQVWFIFQVYFAASKKHRLLASPQSIYFLV